MVSFQLEVIGKESRNSAGLWQAQRLLNYYAAF
jgi:hypothetical protein